MVLKLRNQGFYKLLVMFGFVLSFVVWKCEAYVRQLDQMNIDKRHVTLSGFSSGGNFAQQLYLSYSNTFTGLAVFSHVFYRCGPANGNATEFDSLCTKQGNKNADLQTKEVEADKASKEIEYYYSLGLIDDPENLQDKPLYVYAGTRNDLFSMDMMMGTVQILEPYVNNVDAVKVRVQDASFLFPTNNFGSPCKERADGNMFLGNCDLSGAFEALQFLHGKGFITLENVKEKVKQTRGLQEIDQTEFFGDSKHYLDRIGYLYVPYNCMYSGQPCPLHVYFHGCHTGREFNGTRHIKRSGFLEVAEAANIIMLFPQIARSSDNEMGCWDSFGLTGPYYATRAGAQVSAIRRMVARILGEDPTTVYEAERRAALIVGRPYRKKEQHPKRKNHQNSSVMQALFTSIKSHLLSSFI